MRRISSRAQWSVVSCQLVICLLFVGTAFGKDENYRFTLDFGYRWKAGFRGSQDLYRSQLNYGAGVKLFAGDFFISAPQGGSRYFDRFELKMNSWGGEPYNTAQFRAVKTGLYELRFDYQNADYFNAIPAFANPAFGQGNLQTQHKYDIAQRFARIQLTLRPGKHLSPFLAYERAGRRGPVRTTLAADGDEFQLRSNVDTHSDDFRFGAEVSFSRFSLLLEQGFRWYRDDSSFDASGFQQGNSTRRIFGRDVTLNKYAGRNHVKARIPFSNGVAVYQPSDSLSLQAKVSYSIADLDSSFTDQIAGTFFSTPLTAFYSSSAQQTVGSVKKPNLFGDFSAEWQPFDKFRLIERVNIRRFHVSGSALANSTFLQVEPVLEQEIIDRLQTSKPFETFLSMDSDTQELQGLFYATPRFVLRVGHRYERKEVKLDQRFSWGRNVLTSGIAYDFSARNRIAADYEFGRTNQPIVRTDPANFHRLRMRGKFSPFEALEIDGSITLFDNDDRLNSIDFTSRDRDYALQVNYAPTRRVAVSADYQRSSIRTNLLFIVPQTFLADRSLYREKGDYASLFLSFTLVRNATLNLGYSVWGTVGNFPINYHRPTARLEMPFGNRLVAYGQWNYYDYNEKLSLFPQDYRAHLVVFGFRVALDGK